MRPPRSRRSSQGPLPSRSPASLQMNESVPAEAFVDLHVLRYHDAMTSEPSGPLKPVGGGGRAFLGVRRMEPQDDGVHLFDDDGADLATVRYGEQVYVNGRVISFRVPTPGEPDAPRR